MVCEVIDQGRNYSEQLFENLGRQFSFEETAFNLNLGIELGLAQMIMEAHKGKIVFEKNPEGKGCVKMVFSESAQD